MPKHAAPAPFQYVDADVPEGMTLSTWRGAREAGRGRRGLRLPRISAPLRPRFVG